MEISYRNSLKGSFMIMSEIVMDEIDDFSLKMISRNHIPGFLKLNLEIVNGEGKLLWDISSLQTYEKELEKGKIRMPELKALVSSMINVVEAAGEYLLDEEGLMFAPDMIFTDPERMKYGFCFDLMKKGKMHQSLKQLFEQLIGNIDYTDPELVKMTYEMSLIVQRDIFSFSDLRQCMDKYDEQDHMVIRKMFISEEAEQELNKKIEAMEFPSDTKEVKPEPILSLDSNADMSFGEKLKLYVKRRNLREIVADIDDGVLIKEIKRVRPDVKLPELSGNGKQFSGAEVSGISGDKASEYMSKQPGSSSNIRLISRDKGKKKEITIDIEKYPFTIGKLKGECDYVLKEGTVSRKHLQLEKDNVLDTIYVTDLGSTNGTKINGRRIESNSRKQVSTGDVLTIADQEFVIQL